jgi:hypothetical protein
METSGAGSETSIATLRADDDVAFAPATTFDANGEFGAGDAVDPRTPHSGLDNFARNNGSSCGRAAHIELPTADGGLDGSRLVVIKHLLLAGASRECG